MLAIIRRVIPTAIVRRLGAIHGAAAVFRVGVLEISNGIGLELYLAACAAEQKFAAAMHCAVWRVIPHRHSTDGILSFSSFRVALRHGALRACTCSPLNRPVRCIKGRTREGYMDRSAFGKVLESLKRIDGRPAAAAGWKTWTDTDLTWRCS